MSLTATLNDAPDRGAVFSGMLTELQDRPAIAVFEDVHWADEATLDLLRYLGRRIARTTALLVLTYRDDEIGPTHPLRTVLGDLASSSAVAASAAVAAQRAGCARARRSALRSTWRRCIDRRPATPSSSPKSCPVPATACRSRSVTPCSVRVARLSASAQTVARGCRGRRAAHRALAARRYGPAPTPMRPTSAWSAASWWRRVMGWHSDTSWRDRPSWSRSRACAWLSCIVVPSTRCARRSARDPASPRTCGAWRTMPRAPPTARRS